MKVLVDEEVVDVRTTRSNELQVSLARKL